jgi:hypothetical protein
VGSVASPTDLVPDDEVGNGRSDIDARLLCLKGATEGVCDTLSAPNLEIGEVASSDCTMAMIRFRQAEQLSKQKISQ